eukprot:NODE_4425_length_1893_cov_7.861268.p1 GENE.NODE_4425_length_1893_cov_7.861268~~NODE_4425_length_1893_cov_7.861268.p1  ORF type:complete len:491 (+),score=130.29 NODE_4425_length_1893_cov_7.861268:41-1474(+)
MCTNSLPMPCGSALVPVHSWSDFLAVGAANGNAMHLLDARRSVEPGSCAAVIYTSGTTGKPKGVMLSHDALVFSSFAWRDLIANSTGMGQTDCSEERYVSFLPLSHVAALVSDVIATTLCADLVKGSAVVHFARPYDLKNSTIKDRLVAVRPTRFLGVPLVYEKMADKIRAIGAETKGIAKKIAAHAKDVTLQYAQSMQVGGSGSCPLAYNVADSIVLSRIKGAIGLDACRFCISGGAPMRCDTLEFFASLGISIFESYGMTEISGACTFSCREAHQWGSCGFALPGVVLQCFREDTGGVRKACPRAPTLLTQEEEYRGELCVRSRALMTGYMACPLFGAEHGAETRRANAETVDTAGWLRTGDQAMISTAGMVKITGRFKEIIIGMGGENIAPVPIEDHVKTACAGINEVVMLGNGRKFNVALITLKALGANGELTATKKLKRKIVEARYAENIEQMYTSTDNYVEFKGESLVVMP